MKPALSQYIPLITSANTLRDANRCFIKLLKSLGYPQYVYTQYDNAYELPEYQNDLVAPALVKWHEHFHAQGYERIDQVGHAVKKQAVPELWDLAHQVNSDNRQMKKMVSEALRYGLSSGLSIPIESGLGDKAILVLHHPSIKQHYEEQPEKFFALQSLTKLYLQRRLMLRRQSRLTKRELEVLQYCVNHSSAEIADIINRTERTVTFHLDNIKQKLGVSSKTQAVYVGLKLNLIA